MTTDPRDEIDRLTAELAATCTRLNACRAEREMWRHLANAWVRSKRKEDA